MNIAELAKKRKEEEASRLAAETLEANKLLAEAKALGGVSSGIMGSNSVARSMEGEGDKASPGAEGDNQPEFTVDSTQGGAQDAVAGVAVANGLDPKDLEKGMAFDPITREKFVMPNPLLIREQVAEPELKKGPPGSFRSLRLKRFFDQNGSKIEPNEDGFFIPQSQWEYDELKHYEKQYGMVEYQGDAEE